MKYLILLSLISGTFIPEKEIFNHTTDVIEINHRYDEDFTNKTFIQAIFWKYDKKGDKVLERYIIVDRRYDMHIDPVNKTVVFFPFFEKNRIDTASYQWYNVRYTSLYETHTNYDIEQIIRNESNSKYNSFTKHPNVIFDIDFYKRIRLEGMR